MKDPVRRALLLPSGERVLAAEAGPPGNSPLVLMLPGLKGSDLGLHALADPLIGKGYSVVTLNFPGMGTSPSLPDHRYDVIRLSNIVIEVILELSPRMPVTLLGHSFGATIAMAVAVERDDLVRELVLVSPVVRPMTAREGIVARFSSMCLRCVAAPLMLAWPSLTQRLIASNALDLLIIIGLARRGFQGVRRIRDASRAERYLRPEIGPLIDQMLAAHGHGCMDFVPRARIPCSIISGTRDQMSTVAELEALSQTIGSCLKLVQGAGHLAHHEDVLAVVHLLDEWVDDFRTNQ